jgi:hypothetical protein
MYMVHASSYIYIYKVFQLSKFCVLAGLNFSLCYLRNWVDLSVVCVSFLAREVLCMFCLVCGCYLNIYTTMHLTL